MKIFVLLLSLVTLAFTVSVNCNASLGSNVLENEEALVDCKDLNVCAFSCDHFYPKCDKVTYYGNFFPKSTRHEKITKKGKLLINSYLDTCFLQKYSKKKFYLKSLILKMLKKASEQDFKGFSETQPFYEIFKASRDHDSPVVNVISYLGRLLMAFKKLCTKHPKWNSYDILYKKFQKIRLASLARLVRMFKNYHLARQIWKYKKKMQKFEKKANQIEGGRDELSYYRNKIRNSFIKYIQKSSGKKEDDDRLCQCKDFLKVPYLKGLIEKKLPDIKENCQKVCFE